MSQELEIRKRVNEDSLGVLAVDPKGLAVRGDANAVAGLSHIGTGFVGKLYSSHLRVRRKIYHGEPVQTFKVYEDPAARAVGAALDSHGEYLLMASEPNLPNGLLSLDINYG